MLVVNCKYRVELMAIIGKWPILMLILLIVALLYLTLIASYIPHRLYHCLLYWIVR